MIEKIKELRIRTGSGVLACKEALTEAKGDMEKAIEILRKKGIALSAKKAIRETADGVIDAYIHPGNRLGVLIEVNCESDFVARTHEFKAFVHEMCLQIAASDPLAISREGLSSEVIEREKRIYESQALQLNKPPKVIERIVQGRMEKFYADVCLLEQPFIKFPEKTVGEYIKEQIAKFGENIKIRRVSRFKLGE